MNKLTSEEAQKILLDKPVLTNSRDKIKFITFYALACRGWKGVGSAYSGIMTKNGFTLNLYRSDASRFQLLEPSPYLVPAAITLFTVPNAGWVLERYNKLYDSGKMQTMWDYLYDTPESINNSPTFLKFIEQVDALTEKQEIELQSLGSYYVRNSEHITTFTQYKGNIADTGIFTSLSSFSVIQKGDVYKIASAVNKSESEKHFILQQISPPSSIESIVSLTDFYDHYRVGEIIPLRIIQTENENFELVEAGGIAMGGIPPALLRLNLSHKRLEVLGTAIIERLYIPPLLIADELFLDDVLELLRNSTEYEILYQLPNDGELVQVMLEYARADFSLYRPLALADAAEARFELGELLESTGAMKESLAQEYSIPIAELMLDRSANTPQIMHKDLTSPLTLFANDFIDKVMEDINASVSTDFPYNTDDVDDYALIRMGVQVPNCVRIMTRHQKALFNVVIAYLTKRQPELFRLAVTGKAPSIFSIRVSKLSDNDTMASYQILAQAFSKEAGAQVRLEHVPKEAQPTIILAGDGVPGSKIEWTLADFVDNYDTIFEHSCASTNVTLSTSLHKLIINFQK